MEQVIVYDRYESLCSEVWEHNKRYYVDHQPVITDEEFDALIKQLEEIERQHPEWISSASPTQRVGEVLTEGFKTVLHKTPMLSLENCYSKEELIEFIKRMHKLTENPAIEFSCELKMDGIAVSVCYEKGRFVRAVTRGDGKKGDDITQNVRTIEQLPLQLIGNEIPDLLEVRGEVYMTRDVFESLNQQRLQEKDELWANPRNAAAGTLKLLDPKEAARRRLSLAFYGVAEESTTSLKTQYECHDYLKSLGLPTLELIARSKNLEDIWNFIEKVGKIRSTLQFGIDGVVVKLNERQQQRRLGSTAKHPRWAIAYKFSAEQVITKITGITLQVGRSGVLTPVAELEPVLLAGSTISRATLHNEEEIQRKDIRVGDSVYIEKGGDVIPKVVKVIVEKRDAKSLPWVMPEVCPVCQTKVVRFPGEVAVRCPNIEGCLEQIIRRIVYFSGKDAMDIENMGEKVVEQLVSKGFIKMPSDIYKLTAAEISQLDGFKEKATKNLLDSIEKSRNVTLQRFIMALGIKFVGSGTAEEIARGVGSVDQLFALNKEKLIQMEGVGEKVANSVLEFFACPSNREEITKLLEGGVKPVQTRLAVDESHSFFGKTFVLTGAMHHYTRNEAISLIKERGGKISDSISKKTDYLIIGDDPGSKFEKAKALKVSILTESEFMKLL